METGLTLPRHAPAICACTVTRVAQGSARLGVPLWGVTLSWGPEAGKYPQPQVQLLMELSHPTASQGIIPWWPLISWLHHQPPCGLDYPELS